MSVKLKLSYTEESELKAISDLLKPYIKKQSLSKEQKSKFKRVYFDLAVFPKKPSIYAE